MFAAPADFADYRAFRLAAPEGTRLWRAQTYLRRHPRGAWADEVRSVFEAEEGAWFEVAKTSPARARDYIVDLPHGPHAQAARALLLLSIGQESDIGMLEQLADARRTAAMLDLESARREHVSEVVLEELAALIDPATRGASLDDPPHALAVVLRGSVARTWGTAPQGIREDEFYFVLPTPTQPQARVAQVRLRLVVQRGRVIGGNIEGEDLFVRWAEANGPRVLDAASSSDRARGASEIADVFAGALEARFPASRCAARPQRARGEILARACNGWRVSVRMGAHAGNDDVISVRVR
jgi:hypothetical protein